MKRALLTAALLLILTGCRSPHHFIDAEFSRTDQLDHFAEEMDLFFYHAAKSNYEEVSITIKINGFGNQFRLLAKEIAEIHGYHFTTWGEEKDGFMTMYFYRPKR